MPPSDLVTVQPGRPPIPEKRRGSACLLTVLPQFFNDRSMKPWAEHPELLFRYITPVPGILLMQEAALTIPEPPGVSLPPLTRCGGLMMIRLHLPAMPVSLRKACLQKAIRV